MVTAGTPQFSFWASRRLNHCDAARYRAASLPAAHRSTGVPRMSSSWPFIRLFLPAAAAAGVAGCVGTTALSQLDQARALGGPFSQALFKNYASLARSFGTVGTPS